MVGGWWRSWGCQVRWVAPMVVGAVLMGCASIETAPKTPTLRDDFLEYRELVVRAMARVDSTLRSLDEVSVQANADPRRAYKAFAKAVQDLEVGSIKVRERTQAMRARGDAYFERWQEYLASVPNEEVRRRAKEHEAELKQCFEGVRQGAQQAREAFRPFLTDLQKLRAVLEAEPTLARINAQKSLILDTKDKGREVQRGLDCILVEMNAVMALLRPTGAPAKR